MNIKHVYLRYPTNFMIFSLCRPILFDNNKYGMPWFVVLLIVVIVIVAFAAMVLPYIINAISDERLEKKYDEWREEIVKNNKPTEAHEFLNTYIRYDFEGVYIIHNISKDKYYVGQSINVVGRVRNHLKGSGNGDVYADFKYGDNFEVILIALEDTEYTNLNDLERNCIAAYHAFDKGYNKNRGNS